MSYLGPPRSASASQYLNDCLNIDPVNYACLDNLGVAEIQAESYDAGNGKRSTAHTASNQSGPRHSSTSVTLPISTAIGSAPSRITCKRSRLIRTFPSRTSILGIDFEHNGLYSLAQAALIKGVAAAPYDGRVRYLLARAYAAQGQKALALAQLKAAASSLDPDVSQIAKEETARLDRQIPRIPISQ